MVDTTPLVFTGIHVPSIPAHLSEGNELLAGLPAKTSRIVIIDDNAGDVFLMEESLREHQVDSEVTVVSNGEEAITLFERIGQDPGRPRPHLVLLDLNLPKQPGHRVLERIRCSRCCPTVPVVIVTSSDSETDLAENRRLGATAYFRKPNNLDSFMKLGALVKTLLAS